MSGELTSGKLPANASRVHGNSQRQLAQSTRQKTRHPPHDRSATRIRKESDQQASGAPRRRGQPSRIAGLATGRSFWPNPREGRNTRGTSFLAAWRHVAWNAQEQRQSELGDQTGVYDRGSGQDLPAVTADHHQVLRQRAAQGLSRAGLQRSPDSSRRLAPAHEEKEDPDQHRRRPHQTRTRDR